MRKSDSGIVYFVAAGDDAVKIGVSNSPRGVASRVQTMQTGNHNKLNVVGFIRASAHRELESAIHRHFADERIRGEWFSISDGIMGLLRHDGVCTGPPKENAIKHLIWPADAQS